eukprot:749705-Pleurochrysis_carterae.AAC.1
MYNQNVEAKAGAGATAAKHENRRQQRCSQYKYSSKLFALCRARGSARLRTFCETFIAGMPM